MLFFIFFHGFCSRIRNFNVNLQADRVGLYLRGELTPIYIRNLKYKKVIWLK